MNISTTRVVSFVFLLAGVCVSQSAGNLPVYSGSTAITGLTPATNEIHSSAFTSPTLQTLISACPTGTPNPPCKVVLDPSTTAIKVPSTTTIGSASQWVTVENRGVELECTGSSGDCIQIGQWGALVCTHIGPISDEGGCFIGSSSTFSGSSLVTNADKSGAQNSFTLTGHNIAATGGATITDAPLWIVAVEGKGIVRDTSVLCVAGGYGLLLQDGSMAGTTADNNALVFENDTFIGGGAACNAPIAIMGGKQGTAGNILFVGGTSVDTKGGSGCHSGHGCLIYIDGSANSGSYVSSITFENFYLETGTNSDSSMNYIEVRNARGVELNNILFGGGPAIAECLTVSHSAAGDTGFVHLTGRVLGARCSGVSNSISGNSLTTTGSGDIDYLYPGDQSPGAVLGQVVIDGPQRLAPVTFSGLAACSSTTEGTTATISDGPSTPTWAQSVTGGGGTQPVLLFCDGTNWTVAAK